MAFDLASAKPVAAPVAGGFDLSTAKPVASPSANLLPGEGALRQFAHGASFGFDAKLAGLVSAATGGDYKSARDAYEREAEAYRVENPKTSFALNLAGGVASGTGIASTVGKLAAATAAKAAWPKTMRDQIAAVLASLHPAPLAAAAVAATFKRSPMASVQAVLDALEDLGRVHQDAGLYRRID